MSTVASAALSERDFRRVSQVVHQHCGINLHDGKKELVQARLAKMLRHSGFATPEEFLDHVLDRPESKDFADLIDSLSTNLTSFFRENQHFLYLQEHFLPTLLARKRASGSVRLRAWSAASSTGEEPYTLAMVVNEAMEAAGLRSSDVRILATDISHRVLAVARRGEYEKQRVAQVPPALRQKYFSPVKGDKDVLAVSAAARQLVRYAHLNLIDAWPFSGPFDFIFCRNVMIYFDKPTQQRLVQRFWEVLEPGGMLFTGHSESLTGVSHKFKFVQATIYQKA